MKHILLLLLLAVSISAATAQNLVYNLVERNTGSGSGTWTSKGIVLLIPSVSPSDGLHHASVVTFRTWASRFSKAFWSYEDFVYDDGSGGVYGGLSTALARIGKSYYILASLDGQFNSETISGVATYGAIARTSVIGYYAKTLARSSSYYNLANQDVLGSTSQQYQFAYKYSTVASYTLNADLTKRVISLDTQSAEQSIKDYLRDLGFVDTSATP